MANYNTFVVIDTKTRKNLLVTSSARKIQLETGKKVEIWNGNEKTKTIYARNRKALREYVELEKEYIRNKQKAAEERNKRRKH